MGMVDESESSAKRLKTTEEAQTATTLDTKPPSSLPPPLCEEIVGGGPTCGLLKALYADFEKQYALLETDAAKEAFLKEGKWESIELTTTDTPELVVPGHRERLDLLPIFSFQHSRDGQLVRYRGFVINKGSEAEIFNGFRSNESRTGFTLFKYRDEMVTPELNVQANFTGSVELVQDPRMEEQEYYWDRTTCDAIPVPYESRWVEAGLQQSKHKRTREDSPVEGGLLGQDVGAENEEQLHASRREECVELIFADSQEEEAGVAIHDVVDVVAVVSLAGSKPRLHVLKVIHKNQRLPIDFIGRHFQSMRSGSVDKKSVEERLAPLREAALKYIGDNIVHTTSSSSSSSSSTIMRKSGRLFSEYLLMALCSTKSKQQTEESPLGMTPMNFVLAAEEDDGTTSDTASALSALPGSVKNITTTLRRVHPYVYHLDASLDGLNGAPFRGHKDPETDEMKTGLLELAAGSVLVVDETELQSGQLKDEAVVNAAVLTKVLRTQKVPIFFGFYELEFASEAQGIVFSKDSRSAFLSGVKNPGSKSCLAMGKAVLIPPVSSAAVTAHETPSDMELSGEEEKKMEIIGSTSSSSAQKIEDQLRFYFHEVNRIQTEPREKKQNSAGILVSLLKLDVGPITMIRSSLDRSFFQISTTDKKIFAAILNLLCVSCSAYPKKFFTDASPVFELSDDVQKAMVDAYAATRQQYREKELVEEDLLYAWLDLFQAYCFSHGCSSPTLDLWKKFHKLELQRLAEVDDWLLHRKCGKQVNQ
ncbi:unnamed protein product [Amoebophrya sp. A120]|nr:unnamed protein product [Amoebophrya sp. A120]|eukprot:GSA120T00003395001.1